MMKRIDELFSSRAFLKLVSLVLAFLLWFYVTGGSDTDIVRSYRLPLQLRNVPSELAIQRVPRDIEVQVAANRFLASNIIPEKDIVCYVDLQGLGPGRHTVPVKVSLSAGLKLISLNPSIVELRLDRTVEKSISVMPELPQVMDGYVIRSITISPSEVIVRGSESDIENITKAVITPTLADLLSKEKRSFDVILEPRGYDWSSVTVIPSKVDLEAEVDIIKTKKEVPVIVPIEGEPHPDYLVTSIVTAPGAVLLEGPKLTLDEIKAITTKPLDIKGITNNIEVQLPISVPKNVTLLGETNVTVRVSLKQKIATMRYENLMIEVRGRSIYKEWEISPDKVNVIITGPPSLIASVEGKEPAVTAYVDITNIVSRRLSIPVNVEIKVKGIEVTSIDPERVTFTVVE